MTEYEKFIISICASLAVAGVIGIIFTVRDMIRSAHKRDQYDLSFAEFKEWVDGIIAEGDPRVVMSPMMATCMVAISVLLTESAWRRDRIFRKFNRDVEFVRINMKYLEQLRAEKEEENNVEQGRAD